MKYELTELNVKDLIEWLRGGHVNRAVIALEHLDPIADISAREETVDDLADCYEPVMKADALGFALMEHLGPSALTGGTMSVHDAFVLGWNAARQRAESPCPHLHGRAELTSWVCTDCGAVKHDGKPGFTPKDAS